MSRVVDVAGSYNAFLAAKRTPGVVFNGDGTATLPEPGVAATKVAVRAHAPHLHEYQSFALAFAMARKRAALFLECGLGKTSVALAWMHAVGGDGHGVICAPLAALHEFENERDKFFRGMDIAIVPTSDFDEWLNEPWCRVALVTHHAFVSPRDLSGVTAFVLDESSILKSGDGAIARSLVTSCRTTEWKLALSATPAPNDPTEYATHATWLGYMKSDAEFRARFFVRDGKEWRIKRHAVEALPRWLARFSLWMAAPSAYQMACDALPDEDYSMEYVHIPSTASHLVEHDLFGTPSGAMDMSTRAAVRRELYRDPRRTAEVIRLCRDHRSIVWVTRNKHADAIEGSCRDAGFRVAQIAGATPDEERVAAVRAFQSGELDVLVSKPSVIGHGVNLQSADRMVFAGYDESYESMHQAIRRAHRQGRVGVLEVFVITSPEETPVIRALEAKRDLWVENANRQQAAFVKALESDIMNFHQGKDMATTKDAQNERLETVRGGHYTLVNDDCIAHMMEMDESSMDLAVFSPPFASLFTYSSEPEDMGNCSEHAAHEFAEHFHHFAAQLCRVMKPGRAVALHLAQIVAFRSRHGRKGVQDFRGRVITAMEGAGFHYYGEFVIPKNPQAVAIRTKSERLQFTQFKRDSLESSPALNDYVLHFRKPGKQSVPVNNDVSNEEWIRWASGVWGDIDETDVLSYHSARADNDEKHICPLQLTVIERCVRLWSNPGETVFSPFAGIGSEIVTAIRQRRRGYGVELKREYFLQAVRYCETAESKTHHQKSFLSEMLSA